MKSYYGRRVRVYEHSNNCGGITPTGDEGRLLKIDIENEYVMIEDEAGNMVKLFYKLVKLI